MSTVLANTITAVGGGGSTVKVNNDSTYISDGGAVTDSNLVQGLIKVWVNYDGSASGAASRDSFNVSGMTDNGTGDYTTSFTNSMANTNYALLDGSVDDSSTRGSHLCGQSNAHATGSFRANYGVTGDASGDGNIPNDMNLNGSAFVGDLA